MCSRLRGVDPFPVRSSLAAGGVAARVGLPLRRDSVVRSERASEGWRDLVSAAVCSPPSFPAADGDRRCKDERSGAVPACPGGGVEDRSRDRIRATCRTSSRAAARRGGPSPRGARHQGRPLSDCAGLPVVASAAGPTRHSSMTGCRVSSFRRATRPRSRSRSAWLLSDPALAAGSSRGPRESRRVFDGFLLAGSRASSRIAGEQSIKFRNRQH